MPTILATIGATLGKIGISMLMSLLTEDFCKQLVAHSLEKIAAKTENDWDNQVAQSIKSAWNIQ